MAKRFVPYLVLNDYYSMIQSNQLNSQLVDAIGGTTERLESEAWAISKVREYIAPLYNLDMEIMPTLPYSNNKVYKAGSRCTIDFPDWVAGTGIISEGNPSYNIGDCAIYGGVGYICLQPNFDKVFTPSNWSAIGNQYDIFSVPFPRPVFSLSVQESNGIYQKGFYYVGNQVWWNDKIWTCTRQTNYEPNEFDIQYSETYNIPTQNVFPSCLAQQEQQNNWQTGWDNILGNQNISNEQWQYFCSFFFRGISPYYCNSGDISEGYQFISDYNVPCENPTDEWFSQNQNWWKNRIQLWCLGDNRDSSLKECIMDLAVWKLHKRISPNNIPKLRTECCEKAFEYLKGLKDGILNSEIPILQPEQGESFRWGSKVKQVNGY